jgi:hypothetical protein
MSPPNVSERKKLSLEHRAGQIKSSLLFCISTSRPAINKTTALLNFPIPTPVRGWCYNGVKKRDKMMRHAANRGKPQESPLPPVSWRISEVARIIAM